MSSPQNKSQNFRNNRTPYQKPQYLSTDGFIPLGFSSPIERKTQDQRGNFNKNRNSNYRNKYTNYNDNSMKRNSSGKETDIWAYFHPSMLEDPWKNLTQASQQIRQDAYELQGKQSFDAVMHQPSGEAKDVTKQL